MELTFYSSESLTDRFSPLIMSPVPAGSPRQVEDTFENLDLNDYVSNGSETIFYINVSGQSMLEYGIKEGDLLVANRSRLPKNGDVVIAEIDGSFTIKRFVRFKRHVYLVPENDEYKTRRIAEDEQFAVWGVVTHVVHRF